MRHSVHSFLGFYVMSVIATNNRKNIVALQVYPQKPLKMRFSGKMTPFGKIVVSYMVLNLGDQEPRLEWSKTRLRPILLCPKANTETLKLSLETNTRVSRTTSLLLA